MPKPSLKLSPRHRQVVENYFGVSNFNKTDALRRAGYAHPNKNHEMFNYPAIAAEIERREKRVRERYDVSYERVVDELARIAFSSPLDFMDVDEEGNAFIDLTRADADTLRALGEIKIETYVDGRGKDAERVKRVTVKPWNKQAALEALMRHAGLSKEKSPFEGAGDLVDRITRARRRVGQVPEEEGE